MSGPSNQLDRESVDGMMCPHCGGVGIGRELDADFTHIAWFCLMCDFEDESPKLDTRAKFESRYANRQAS